MTPQEETQWHDWFAWYPVADTRTDETIFLETCLRRRATYLRCNIVETYWVYSKITGGGQMMPVT